MVTCQHGGVQDSGPQSDSDRRDIATAAVVAAVVWLLFSSAPPLLPVRWFVTLLHEAGHALMVMLVGGTVKNVTINPDGGGLTQWAYYGDISTTRRVLVASAGYVGAAVVGGLMIELSARMRQGRVAAGALALLVAGIGIAWVPWSYSRPTGQAAATAGTSSGDGRFTTLFCLAAVAFFAALMLQPRERLRRLTILGLATILCLASIDDLRMVMDISSRGGHSDAATAAAATPLSSWMWAVLWLMLGLAACGLGLWSALGRGHRSGPASSTSS